MFKKGLPLVVFLIFIFGVSFISISLIDTYLSGSSVVKAKPDNNNGHWIGAWSTSQIAPHAEGISQEGFNEQTVRMVVHPNASGEEVRIRFSNTFGTKPLTFNKVTVADTDEGANIVQGSIQSLTFNGETSVTIPVGEEVFSDSLPFQVTDGSDLTISTYISKTSGPTTWHPISNQTTYISPTGDYTATVNGSAFNREVNSWFWLSGVDVLTKSNKKTRVIAALGDSITDGYLSTLNENRRWTDVLNDRLDSEMNNQSFSVLNLGISGNRILSDSPIFGEQALDRLERDVFSQTGVTDIILLEGINDIGHEPHVFKADQIIEGIKTIASEAHDRGIRIYVGTLTPFRAFMPGEYFTEEGEETRKEVNAWIRNNEVLDGFIDFERVLANPDDPERMLEVYDSGDHLHPNDSGLKAMADSIDLSIFKNPSFKASNLQLH